MVPVEVHSSPDTLEVRQLVYLHVKHGDMLTKVSSITSQLMFHRVDRNVAAAFDDVTSCWSDIFCYEQPVDGF